MADLHSPLPSPPLLDDACALFLDVDGTLIDFADRPEAVRLLPEVRAAIERLSDRFNGAVALVSGRPLSQLDALFAPLLLPAAGLHGHELRSDIAARAAMPQDTSEWLHGLHQRAAALTHQHPGVLVEDKGVSVALHWRAQPLAGPDVLAFAQQEIAQLSGYRLQPGDHVVEFVPEGSNKGLAVEQLMQQPAFAGRTPVFVGDDLTDEFGFQAANRLGGWSVLVGDRAQTDARFRVPGTAAVHAWLQRNAHTA
ncbi:trehalose-phosphatase [Xanthomonas campestris pv. raphani]|uniref:trehalose-phosphatase n=1 Tax=Xanthomonas campestris TaxID=339 RepID=UPI002367B1A7|nr:trehalose-phosphatase [Xanthomonas campestris]MEA9821972.1 trehalose-phosphatase [Xanthomonas campestris pv. raphani]MEA9850282.1 trehalose-phosphatase [Xanthomonas campestris pv. raphani]MEA9854688.1 trehalose-phosphatase [Xanthomonas campestris pv. raphani]MEA9886899.1 trehalose-phosphatase [Xanthomonas campestris pv. raphani]MEA9963413.1 trehalose-phosphatase [Xanthomonas campestris pv. raphani]